jgi:hypothetical protein
MQSALLAELQALGQDPPVIDARDLLLDPPGVLAGLCARLGIAFDSAMLAWPAGPRPEDGIWAKHWYHAVHRSTGFQPYRPKQAPFPSRLQPLLAQCAPHYAQLTRHAIRSGARPAGV